MKLFKIVLLASMVASAVPMQAKYTAAKVFGGVAAFTGAMALTRYRSDYEDSSMNRVLKGIDYIFRVNNEPNGYDLFPREMQYGAYFAVATVLAAIAGAVEYSVRRQTDNQKTE